MRKPFSLMLLCATVAYSSCSKNDDYISVEQIELDKILLELTKGYSATLIATLTPEKADNQKVEWGSLNTDIATVSESGKVTGVSAGSTTIIASSADGGKIAICTVKVTPETTTGGFPTDTYEVSEYSETGYAEIHVAIDDEMLGNLTCTVEAEDDDAVGTGADWDYKLTNTEVKIEKGSKEGKVIVSIHDSRAQKEDRAFNLKITSIRSDNEHENVSLNDIITCKVTIKKQIREATFAEPLITASKQTSPIDFGLMLTAPVDEDVTLSFAPKSGASAKEGVDYKLTSNQVTIKAGETLATTKIEIFEDVDAYCEFEITDVTGNVDVAMNASCRLEIRKISQ